MAIIVHVLRVVCLACTHTILYSNGAPVYEHYAHYRTLLMITDDVCMHARISDVHDASYR